MLWKFVVDGVIAADETTLKVSLALVTELLKQYKAIKTYKAIKAYKAIKTY